MSAWTPKECATLWFSADGPCEVRIVDGEVKAVLLDKAGSGAHLDCSTPLKEAITMIRPSVDDRLLLEGYLARKHGLDLPRWHRFSNRWPRWLTSFRVLYLRARRLRGAQTLREWGR
jgi:hypothetical protein